VAISALSSDSISAGRSHQVHQRSHYQFVDEKRVAGDMHGASDVKDLSVTRTDVRLYFCRSLSSARLPIILGEVSTRLVTVRSITEESIDHQPLVVFG
jgi:hypothetical protein